jgi:subtilisin family serine protease
MAGKSRLQKKNNINCNHDIPPVLMERSHRQLFLIAVIIIVTMESLQQANATDVIARMGDRRKTTSGTTSTTNYIVSFADMDVSPAKRCAALAKSMGGTVHQVYDHVLNGCSISTAVQAQSAFTALKNSLIVNFVAENQVVFIDDQEVTESNNIFEDSTSRIHSSSTVAAATSWGLDRINQCALPLDNITTKQDATGVKVFVIDTGIYAEHEDFANGVIGSDDCHFSVFPGDNPLTDGHGHG